MTAAEQALGGVSAWLGWVDLCLLALTLVSVLVGIWRGLVFELMALVGWLVAYVLAQLLAAPLGLWIPVGAPGSALNHGVAFAAAFVLALLGWTLLSRLVRLVLHATPLTLLDRTLGAVFGLMRGLLLLLVLATVVAMTPAARSPAWQSSLGAQALGTVLQGLQPVLPDAVARHLPQPHPPEPVRNPP